MYMLLPDMKMYCAIISSTYHLMIPLPSPPSFPMNKMFHHLYLPPPAYASGMATHEERSAIYATRQTLRLPLFFHFRNHDIVILDIISYDDYIR